MSPYHISRPSKDCQGTIADSISSSLLEALQKAATIIAWQPSLPPVNGLVQVRRNSIADTVELRFSCANPS